MFSFHGYMQLRGVRQDVLMNDSDEKFTRKVDNPVIIFL